MGEGIISWIQGIDHKILVGVVVGLGVVLVSVLALFLSKRRWGTPKVQGGTKFVTTDDGQLVRRSQRSRKEVARWSPDDLSSPTGYKTPSKSGRAQPKDVPVKPTPPAKRSRFHVDAVEATATDEILTTPKAALPASIPPPAKRGRPRKVSATPAK